MGKRFFVFCREQKGWVERFANGFRRVGIEARSRASCGHLVRYCGQELKELVAWCLCLTLAVWSTDEMWMEITAWVCDGVTWLGMRHRVRVGGGVRGLGIVDME